jgi:hypothetical protein
LVEVMHSFVRPSDKDSEFDQDIVNLHEHFKGGSIISSQPITLPADHDPEQGLEVSIQFPQAKYELGEFTMAHFDFSCSFEMIDPFYQMIKKTYEESGLVGFEKLGFKQTHKRIKFLGELQISQLSS